MSVAAKDAKRASGKRPRQPIIAESIPSTNGACITRRQRRGIVREYAPIEDFATLLGLDTRTLKKYLRNEEFVRKIGGRWLVHEARWRTWLDQQRPKQSGRARGGR